MKVWSCALPKPAPPTPRVLRAVQTIWGRMTQDPRNAGPILSSALREMRSLGSKERPATGDMLLGLIRHEYALSRIDPDPIRAWLILCDDGIPDLPEPPDPYGTALSMPPLLAAEWWSRLGPDRAIGHARVIAGRAPVTLRVLRDPVDLPVPHRRVGKAIMLEARANLHVLDAWREGRVELQDLGSQRIAEAAFPGEGARVLDLCAGAGGKSLTLASLGARVDAWDVRPHALRELEQRARRAGLSIRVGPPEGRYDLVLVDAPCSGTGVLRRHPENRWKLNFPTVEQSALLQQARKLGGRVVYATCALTFLENETLVRSVAEPLWEKTLWPEEGGTEGYYLAEVPGL